MYGYNYTGIVSIYCKYSRHVQGCARSASLSQLSVVSCHQKVQPRLHIRWRVSGARTECMQRFLLKARYLAIVQSVILYGYIAVKSATSIALSVTALSRESAALSKESPHFLRIPRKRCAFSRKRKFLKSAEHIHSKDMYIHFDTY